MAYIVSTLQTAAQATGTSYAVNFPPDVAANDLLLVKLSQDGSTASLGVSASGFTALGTQAISGASSSQWFFKIAAGGETSATFACANDDIIGTAILIRDAYATAPFGSVVSGTDYVRTDWNNVNSAASGSLTTAVDECLLLYSWNSDGTSQYPRCKVDEVIEVDKYSSAAITHIIGCRQQQTAAAAPTVTMYHPLNAEGGNGWVLAVRNKSGGALQPDVRISGVDWKFYGSWIAQHDSVTWGAPDAFAASINSITCSSVVPTVDNTNSWPSSPYGFYTILQSTESTSGLWVGGTHTVTSVDLTGKIVKIEMSSGTGSTSIAAGSEGWLIGFSDGTNWVTYQLKSKAKTWAITDPDSFYVAVGDATAYASSGTIATALSGCTRVGFFYHRVGSTGIASQLHIKNLAYFSRFDLTGGGESRPVTFVDLHNFSSSWSHFKLTNLQGSAQVKAKVSVQVGDGTNDTYFDGAANAIGFPQAWSASTNSNWQMDWNVNSGITTLGVYAKSTDTIKLAAGVATSANSQLFTVHASSDTGATYEFAQAFAGFSATLKTGIPYTGVIFTNCGQIAAKGADLVNCIIKNSTADTTAAVIGFDANGASMTSCTTSATTSTGYHIELGTSVTDFTLTDHTFTGSALTDKVHVLATTGTVTITISGTTTLVAGDVTSAGATVVISAPQPTLSATVLASSRVVLYNNTTAAELDNSAPAGTSWSKVITSGASSNDSLTLHVFKEGYQEFSTTFLYTGDDATILVTQEVDSNIASLRTELSITDYATITEFALDITGTVEIDADDADGSSQKARLAIWYNGILTTENGARYLRGAITILSTAAFRINTSVLDLKIENISATFGLNFTDTERRLYRDDGAPIYAAASAAGSIQNDYSGVPDTVETGVSGLTGSESAQLMALPSASTIATQVLTSAQSTPIYADARKMNGATITGTGVDSDLWRGA